MRGYLGLPQENAEKLLRRENEAFRGYRTGDLGYEAGLIYCQGRNDSQVKLNGYRIEINEIENRLLAMSGINEAVVMPLMKPCGSVLRIAAFCVTELAPDTIKTSLSKVVPHYMVPSQIIVKDALPLNPNGKILALFEKVLSRKVGFHDELIESDILDSILAVDMVLEVQDVYGCTIPPTDVATVLKTPADLARYIEENR